MKSGLQFTTTTLHAPLKRARTSLRFLLALTSALPLIFAQGCASYSRLPAVPTDLSAKASVPGLPNTRYRLGKDNEALIQDGTDAYKREQAYLSQSGQTGAMPTANYLAISGGGDNGAFAAGLLNAWSETGNRPEFKMVTGVSTGALIAPFAFLGPKYDAKLKEIYTNISPKDILEKRWMLAAVTSDAVADNHPLFALVKKQISREMLDEIAAESEKGRILLVGTTDLDARQAVIWNMTKIAASKDPHALELFRTLMVTSAAIPGAFPPTMIDVEVDGKPYQEMHVDGGAMTQVFVYPPGLRVGSLVQRSRAVYIIRNARLDPDWVQVERSMLGISGRAIASLIHTQGIGDLFTIYSLTQRDGVDFNLAYIPASFNAPHKEEFDTDYMRALYDLAYQMTIKGYPWQKTPPGFSPGPNTPAK